MLEEVNGLVIRSVDLGEADRLITLYTKEQGLISTMVKGARSYRNKNMASTQQFCYGSFILNRKGDKSWVSESNIIESFFGLRSDIVALSLAGYIVEVINDVATAEADEDILRLALNSLYAISERRYSFTKIKAAFEIRLCAIIGFMPDVIGCRECGERAGEFYFDIMSGNIECFACHQIAAKEHRDDSFDEREARIIEILSEGAKIALGYCIYSPLERLFAFNISDEDMRLMSKSCEDYLLNQLERSFKSLEFYKEVRD